MKLQDFRSYLNLDFMNLQEIAFQLSALADDPALLAPCQFGRRDRALKWLAFVEEIARTHGDHDDLVELARHAEALKFQIEETNAHLCHDLRVQIQTGAISPAELRARFDQETDYRSGQKGFHHYGPDGLDVLIHGLVNVGPCPSPPQRRDPEMIHYEVTPARAILDLLDHAGLGPEDRFCDVGSGLGEVAILVNLLSRIPAVGIEVEAAYCDYARRSASQLGLSGVKFVEADAREADYSQATILFLFTPFKGKMLRDVLGKLARETFHRPLKICTFGPCTRHVAAQDWLVSLDNVAYDEFQLAMFRRR